MSAFGLPVPPPEVEPLPEAVETEIIRSTVEFERRFGSLAMMARANGWVDDYGKELRRIAVLGHKHGKLAGWNDAGYRPVGYTGA
jgi:hypothetical protein